MAEPFIGEIRMFAMNYAPEGWAQCNGQLLPIQQNQALYAILGTSFGGDGVKNFALPNLQGKVPVQNAAGTRVGQTGGEETHTLTVNEMPQHTHLATAGANATSATPAGNVWGGSATLDYEVQPNVQMSPNALAASGQSQPHSNMQPYTVVNYCIAIIGTFPPRN